MTRIVVSILLLISTLAGAFESVAGEFLSQGEQQERVVSLSSACQDQECIGARDSGSAHSHLAFGNHNTDPASALLTCHEHHLGHCSFELTQGFFPKVQMMQSKLASLKSMNMTSCDLPIPTPPPLS